MMTVTGYDDCRLADSLVTVNQTRTLITGHGPTSSSKMLTSNGGQPPVVNGAVKPATSRSVNSSTNSNLEASVASLVEKLKNGLQVCDLLISFY